MICGRDIVDALRRHGYTDQVAVQAWLDEQVPVVRRQPSLIEISAARRTCGYPWDSHNQLCPEPTLHRRVVHSSPGYHAREDLAPHEPVRPMLPGATDYPSQDIRVAAGNDAD